jgi:Flp pilus assembly pilin Flp
VTDLRPRSLVVDRLKSIAHDEDAGQGLAEYALILALIAIIAIVALLFLGHGVSTALSTVGGTI